MACNLSAFATRGLRQLHEGRERQGRGRRRWPTSRCKPLFALETAETLEQLGGFRAGNCIRLKAPLRVLEPDGHRKLAVNFSPRRKGGDTASDIDLIDYH